MQTVHAPVGDRDEAVTDEFKYSAAAEFRERRDTPPGLAVGVDI
ncbi:hypothetical protein [Natrialba aegyptia]|nr:hypothetical protein [Natrialba aegyptia]